jgi:hypothetical protein
MKFKERAEEIGQHLEGFRLYLHLQAASPYVTAAKRGEKADVKKKLAETFAAKQAKMCFEKIGQYFDNDGREQEVRYSSGNCNT